MSRLDRQSFLGPNSETILAGTTLGVVGLGGGGSHVVQQAAHMGYGRYVVVDPDIAEDTNTNRLVGATLNDVELASPKIAIALRIIRGLQPGASVVAVQDRWQNAIDDLKRCDVIVGAVDSFSEREQLERFARRHLIPYVDIGMDVHELGSERFLIAGQVILSMPGGPCLRCCGLISDELLQREANEYGAAGARPQVVWPNGILASTAMGIITQLVTPWSPPVPAFIYLEYDGNKGTVTQSHRAKSLSGHACPHHPACETGDSLFDIRAILRAMEEPPLAVSAVVSKREPFWHRLGDRLKRFFGL